MRVEQLVVKEDYGPELKGWTYDVPEQGADLILCFWSLADEKVGPILEELAKAHAGACVAGCSTAGEILGHEVVEDSLSLTKVTFSHTSSGCTGVSVKLDDYSSSREAGVALAARIPRDGLRHVLVFSNGLGVNGSDLALGMVESLPREVAVTGGLAGDMDRFSHTSVIHKGKLLDKEIVAVGFYGPALSFGYGSVGGWDVFGPERLITSSKGTELYEMDGESALDLYERYLGKDAEGLPATGLLFPLSIRMPGGGRVVRTILAVDQEARSMTFAGDVPEGAYAQLMRAHFNRLVDGAMDAAEAAKQCEGKPGLGILVSCVGRKLILGQMTEEEVEGVADVLGKDTSLTGFYSYGELAPAGIGECCELHNQTMTVTAICEKD